MTHADKIEAALERAAIMEFDGGRPRELAEREAAKAHGVTVEELREHARRKGAA